MNRLYARLVITDPDWEMLRLMRNLCSDGMTNDQSFITTGMQEEYRRKCALNPRVRHYIYREHGIDIGFSRIEHHHDQYVRFSYGVAPWARGLLLGYAVAKQVLLACGGPIKGDVWETNIASQQILTTLGCFFKKEAYKGRLAFECAWPPPFIQEKPR